MIKTKSLSIQNIYKLIKMLEMVQVDAIEFYQELITYILESKFTYDVMRYELGLDEVADFLVTLLKYSKTENAILIDMARQAIENVDDMNYVNSLKIINYIMDFDGFDEVTKEKLTAKVYKIVEKKREEIKLGKYEMVGTVGVEKNVEQEVKSMIFYDKDRIF